MAFVASGGDVGAVITQLLCIVISFATYTIRTDFQSHKARITGSVTHTAGRQDLLF
jgi:hypothetical protein